MAILEYRLLDEKRNFPVVSYYERISKEEILLRFACDYLIQDSYAYERTSCAIEEGIYIIYVQKNEEKREKDPQLTFFPSWKAIRVEVRHYRDGEKEHPLIHQYDFIEGQEALAHLMSDFLYFDGEEWEKIYAEVNENRKLYTYYARPVAERE